MALDAAAQRQEMERIAAKAWADEEFKQRLLTDANAALATEGIDVPAGLTIKVVENTPDTLHFVLPQPPGEGEISEESLEAVTAGAYTCCQR